MARQHRGSVVMVALLVVVGLLAAACGGDTAGSAPTATAVPAASNLILAADLVLGSKNIPQEQRALRSCTLSSRFPRNSEMVWRVRVTDPKTGEIMSAEELSGVQIQLDNGVKVDMKFGPHPKDPPNESFWTGSWVVPKDHATGTLRYSIVATGTDGRTGEWTPFITQPSLPSITEDVLADVVAPAATPTPTR